MAKRRSLTGDLDERLDAAAGTVKSESSTTKPRNVVLRELPLTQVAANPRNVRDSVGDVTDLAASITAEGLLQPIVVRPRAAEDADVAPSARYLVVMGHRRLAALQQLGLDTVSAIVRQDLPYGTERQAMLIENLHRLDLTALEEARSFKALLDEEGLSQRDLARQVGVSQSHINKRVSLLSLNPGLGGRVAAGRISVDLALAHLKPMSEAGQEQLVEQLDALDTTPDAADGGPYPPKTVQKMAAGIKNAEEQEARWVQQRAAITARGGRVVEHADTEQWLAEHPGDRKLDTDEAVAAAAADGTLVGHCTRWADDPTWYTEAEPDGDLPQDSEVATSIESDQRRWKALLEAMAEWVTSPDAATPRKGEVNDCLAEYILATATSNDVKLAQAWLDDQGRAHNEWKADVLASGGPQLTRAAWLITVAADLHAARTSRDQDAPAVERTRQRIGDVQ